jgi:hypothetical protein
MDTVMSAKAGASARSPVNISPRIVERLRVVVTSMSTLVEFGALSATGMSTFFGWPPHPTNTQSSRRAKIHSRPG